MPRSIYSEEHVRLARLLRDLRVEADVRQVELAQRLSRPQSYVSKYEAGQRRLDLLELRAICTALGTTLTELVTRFEAPTADGAAEG